MIHGADRIETLIDAVIDGRCDEAGLRRLAELLRDGPVAREAYLDQMRMHALLDWRHGRAGMPVDRAPARYDARRSACVGRYWGIAAVLFIGVGADPLNALPRDAGRESGVATLIEARDVVWAEGQPPIAVNARLEPRAIRCDIGDAPALVRLRGPGHPGGAGGPSDPLRHAAACRPRPDHGPDEGGHQGIHRRDAQHPGRRPGDRVRRGGRRLRPDRRHRLPGPGGPVLRRVRGSPGDDPATRPGRRDAGRPGRRHEPDHRRGAPARRRRMVDRSVPRRRGGHPFGPRQHPRTRQLQVLPDRPPRPG